MQDPKTAGKMEGEGSNSERCVYCLDDIPRGALICKSCNEPQGMWRRSTKFLSAALSSVVAAGSLGIAYLQYAQTVVAQKQTEAAQKETVVARAGEAAQVTAAQNAVRQIFNGLPVYQRTNLITSLSRQLQLNKVPDAVSLQSQIQKEPTNTEYRARLLLRQLAPLNSP